MGKVNAAAVAHGRIVAKNTQLYNTNKQAMSRVKGNLDQLTQAQTRYARSSVRRLTTLNSEWRKHGQVIRAQQVKQRAGGFGRGAMGAGMVAQASRGGQRGGGFAGMATGVGGGFFLADAIKSTSDFYLNLNNIKKSINDVDFDRMKRKALEWGRTTQFSSNQVAGAMAEAAQAGMNENEVISSMPGNLALAAAGQMDLVSAMALSTDVVAQFGKTVSNLAVADQLATAASNSTSKVIELGAALRNTGTIAHQAGLTSVDTLKLLMAIGETGLRGEAGGTYLMNMITFMKKMGPKLKKGFTKFLSGTGVELSDIINQKTGQFIDIDKFSKLLITANQEQLNALSKAFEIRGGKAVGSLAQLSIAKFEKFAIVMNDTQGAAKRMANILMEGLPGALKRLDSAWFNAKIMMVDSFIVPLVGAMEAIANFLAYLAKEHKWVLTVTFGLIAFATAMGLVGIAIWAVTGVFGNFLLLGGGLIKMFVLLTSRAFYFKLILFAVSGVARTAAFAVKLLTGAQWLLNAAMSMNPVSLVIIAVAALIALFVYARHKTGSWTNALKFMGGIMIKSVLTPINLAIGAIRLLILLASKITPGKGGTFLKNMYDLTGKMQEDFNVAATGNKSLTVFGMGYDLSQKGVGASTWMKEEERKQTKRTDYVTANPAMEPTTRMGKAMGGYRAPYSPEMMGYVSPEGVNKKASTMEAMTKQAAGMKTEVTVKPIEVKGIIKIITDKGTKVKDMNFTANTGGNMYTLGGVH